MRETSQEQSDAIKCAEGIDVDEDHTRHSSSIFFTSVHSVKTNKSSFTSGWACGSSMKSESSEGGDPVGVCIISTSGMRGFLKISEIAHVYENEAPFTRGSHEAVDVH